MTINTQPETDRDRVSWQVLLLGAAPYLAIGMAEIGAQAVGSGWPWLIAYLVILGGLGFGWVRWFPRWSYAFLGTAVTLTIWLISQPADLTGIPPFWLLCLPGALLILVSLLATRTTLPLLKIVQDVARDWTLASFLLYSILPVAIWLSFSGAAPLTQASGEGVSSLFLALGAAAYFKAGSKRDRALALLAGSLLGWFAAGIFSILYWSGKPQEGASALINPFVQIVAVLITWLALAVLIFFPGLFAAFMWLNRKVFGGNEQDPAGKSLS